MKIVAAGDSFTYGEELANLEHAYPYVLSSLLPGDNSVVNLAQPAGSNDKVVRKLTEYLLDNTADLVVIGWTSPGRLEFADENGDFDIWPGYNGNLFVSDGLEYRSTVNKYFSVYHSKEFLYKKYLQNIILMQTFLKLKNIKYVMMDVVARDPYKNKYFLGEYKKFHNEIDKSCFIEYNTGSMAEWTRGCPKGPRDHFLDLGHQQVANRIYEHIRNLGGLS